VIAALSVNYVERFILEEGHIAQRMENDYGYDLTLFTFDEQGYVEPGAVYLQLKASEKLEISESDRLFDLDIRDYNLWMAESMPVILVLFDASRRRAFWIHVQHYFAENPSLRPKKAVKTVRIRIPIRQALNHRAIARMRATKQTVLDRERGVLYHA